MVFKKNTGFKSDIAITLRQSIRDQACDCQDQNTEFL